MSGYKHENVWGHIGDEKIWESNKQKILGLQIVKNLNFNVSSLRKKLTKNSQSLQDYQIS